MTHFTVDKKEIFGGIRLDGFIEARRRGEIMIKVETKLFFSSGRLAAEVRQTS